ncbi:MAG: hypothetical protein IJV21_03725 [Lachnospiraceae bacterium]|nr:hypothetical protein [Lachnospiraceae bacterium]
MDESNRTVDELIGVCKDLIEMVTNLKKETMFLTDIIIDSKLGRLTEERRRLISENKKLQYEIEKLSN